MYCTKKITDDMSWVGGSDRRLALFENVFPIPKGISYNSYLIEDEKTVLLDTVDKAISTLLFENIEHVLGDKKLDYLVVNHMEPDHAATIEELVMRYPEIKIVGSAKTLTMIKQFFNFDADSRFVAVKEGDTLNTGKHTLTFYMAPMVHWPEVMVTYDNTDKILYSADAFGTFGAIDGNLYADEVNFESDWLHDARRYYTNIVGKYGNQVQSLLKKLAPVEIKMICSLHGPVWRENLDWYIDKYCKWSAYEPEETAVMIAYGTIYGGTENVANIIASKLADAGVRNVVMYDVASTHPSVIVSESFRCSHLVFASASYNAGIFGSMETALLDIKAHNLQNRKVALVENGTWAPTAGKFMVNLFESMKNMEIIGEMLSVKSTLKEDQLAEVDLLVSQIVQSMDVTGK
jgi:flavorubredoxin